MDRRMRSTVLGLAILTLSSVLPWMSGPAAASPCVDGTVADILGTTCTVGDKIQFSFQSWIGISRELTPPGVEVPPHLPVVAAGSVLFAPHDFGFTLTLPDQSVSSPSSGNLVSLQESLLFSLIKVNGYQFTEVLAEHTGVFDVAGTGDGRATAFYAVALNGSSAQVNPSDSHSLNLLNGNESLRNSHIVASSPAIGSAVVFALLLTAENGADATFAGPTRYTFNPVFVPEPSTLLLLAPGLAGLAGTVWRARRRR